MQAQNIYKRSKSLFLSKESILDYHIYLKIAEYTFNMTVGFVYTLAMTVNISHVNMSAILGNRSLNISTVYVL